VLLVRTIFFTKSLNIHIFKSHRWHYTFNSLRYESAFQKIKNWTSNLQINIHPQWRRKDIYCF